MNPLQAKFARYVELDFQDQVTLDALLRTEARLVPAGTDLIREGEPIHFVKLVTEGWGCRYKLLEDGRRQIVAFLLPGDLCNPDALAAEQMDHSIGAVGEMHCALIAPDVFDRACLRSRKLRQALAFDACAMLGTQREWTLNLAARPALARIGALLCELHYRLAALGLAEGGRFVAPVTQITLAEATGLTSVHVNRVVQDLRGRGLLHWQGRSITLPDPDHLAQLSGFNPRYLHMPRFTPGTFAPDRQLHAGTPTPPPGNAGKSTGAF
ncbi:Crp/Fnr family transcriptional regulator [Novosphingobium sp. SG720]|uniref:Crp/Fnr family transcriptional regulator n=1 Tax=Novosphingobium sp. SG720 TaxID=2586998 RepID=UPI001448969F|nr:Crp/Fnr family transcriptional regulator [Novosphingobium sp. SG720]NKJ44678.1 CRP-like cAMP-binding protein [Novosphingobium sp. SG720]